MAAAIIRPSGNVVFSGSLSLVSSHADGLTIDNATNNPDVTVDGDLSIAEIAGTMTWTKGNGTITFSGTENHTITTPSGWTDRLEDIVISKTAGNVVLSGDLYCQSFTGTNTGTGTFDPGGNEIDTVADCSWAAAFDLIADADAMNGCTWDIGGNFTADGQTLNATATWALEVTGTAVASGAGDVEYSDASGFTEITATSWNDGGNNTNWDFGVAGPTLPVLLEGSVLSGGFQTLGGGL